MMLHDDIVAEIQARARKMGILSHYCGHALRCKGDRGAPDLFLTGRHKSAWVEVKTSRDDLAPDQITWMHALKAAGQLHYIIREEQLDDGSLAALLDTLAYGQPVLFGVA